MYIETRGIVSRILALLAVVLIGAGINYLFLPAWNFRNEGVYGFLLFISIVATLIFAITEFIFADDDCYVMTIISAVIAALAIIVWIIGALTSSKLFNVSRYQNLIEIEEGNFEDEVVANNIKVKINYDMTEYMPADSETRLGLDIMNKEFEEENTSVLNVMFKKLTEDEKIEIKEKLSNIEGVSSVEYEADNGEYNKDENTLYILNVADAEDSQTAKDVYEYVNDNFEDYEVYTSGSIANRNMDIRKIQIWSYNAEDIDYQELIKSLYKIGEIL